jgi:hypothetical protein
MRTGSNLATTIYFLDFLHRLLVSQPQRFEGWLFPRHQVNLLCWVRSMEPDDEGRAIPRNVVETSRRELVIYSGHRMNLPKIEDMRTEVIRLRLCSRTCYTNWLKRKYRENATTYRTSNS